MWEGKEAEGRCGQGISLAGFQGRGGRMVRSRSARGLCSPGWKEPTLTLILPCHQKVCGFHGNQEPSLGVGGASFPSFSISIHPFSHSLLLPCPSSTSAFPWAFSHSFTPPSFLPPPTSLLVSLYNKDTEWGHSAVPGHGPSTCSTNCQSTLIFCSTHLPIFSSADHRE